MVLRAFSRCRVAWMIPPCRIDPNVPLVFPLSSSHSICTLSAPGRTCAWTRPQCGGRLKMSATFFQFVFLENCNRELEFCSINAVFYILVSVRILIEKLISSQLHSPIPTKENVTKLLPMWSWIFPLVPPNSSGRTSVPTASWRPLRSPLGWTWFIKEAVHKPHPWGYQLQTNIHTTILSFIFAFANDCMMLKIPSMMVGMSMKCMPLGRWG